MSFKLQESKINYIFIYDSVEENHDTELF